MKTSYRGFGTFVSGFPTFGCRDGFVIGATGSRSFGSIRESDIGMLVERGC